jgi:hypothetical protein
MNGATHHAADDPGSSTPTGTRSRQRVIDHGEVFTPPRLVNDMLDLVAHECERIDSRFLEPACGDGNFLAEVLRRKLRTADKNHPRNRARWERDAVFCLCSLYGIDLLPDNVAACRDRLLRIVDEAHVTRFKEILPQPARTAAAYILSTNIIHGDALLLKAADGQPIVFPEWSAINGMMLKRRDYTFRELLGHAEMKAAPLFSDLGQDVFVPQPVADRPACHYLDIADAKGEQR